jgi:hypothetical protein
MSTFLVSGKAYHACLDPLVSAVPRESGWPEPDFRKVGYGLRAAYDLTAEQAADMIDHLELVGSTFVAVGDSATRAEGRACLDAARGLRIQLAAVGTSEIVRLRREWRQALDAIDRSPDPTWVMDQAEQKARDAYVNAKYQAGLCAEYLCDEPYPCSIHDESGGRP